MCIRDRKYTIKHPIIFPHLLERLNLLVIIIFGETIIGILTFIIVAINISWLVHLNLPHIKKGILLDVYKRQQYFQ